MPHLVLQQWRWNIVGSSRRTRLNRGTPASRYQRASRNNSSCENLDLGLIKESRWPLRLGCADLRDGESTVLILPTTHDDPWWTQRITTLLSDLTANGFPSHLARGLTGAVIEMVDNIWLHSETPHPGLLAASPEHLMRIIRCALDTGLRRGEILSQRWEDIDLDNRILHVSLSKTAEGEARGIPLTNALYDMLHASRQKRGPVFTYQGTDSSLSRSAYSANAIVP